jgi:hypothetical protein
VGWTACYHLAVDRRNLGMEPLASPAPPPGGVIKGKLAAFDAQLQPGPTSPAGELPSPPLPDWMREKPKLADWSAADVSDWCVHMHLPTYG